MTEPTPPPEPTPAPLKKARAINWHRVRVYIYSIILIATMWVCASLLTIMFHPQRAVDGLLAQLPFSSSTGKVYWMNRRTLKIVDLKVGGFFYAESVIVTASPWGLWRHHIAKVVINGGQLFTKPMYAALDKAGSGSGSKNGLDWVIGRLEVSRGTLMLDNLVSDTSIPVRLGVRSPIVLNGLRLGAPDSSPEMKQERVAELVNVALVSPVDPVSPVCFLPLTRVRYTYEEIWHHHIREIDVVRPTLFLGEDLFWLVKEIKAEDAEKPKEVSNKALVAPWKIGHLEVQFGQLAVNAFGQPVARFPFYFGTSVDNIRLDELNKISAKATVPIQRLTEDYPEYKVRIVNLTGNLYFSWPPTDANANNVVNTLNMDVISWNGIPAKQVWTTVTFDPNGVYGKLGGTCEGGQVSGNFEFYYTKGFTWNADLFADKINCQPIAQKLVGKYVNLTGELDGEVAVKGQTTDILKCQGALELPNPGVLEIKSMDDLIKRIPADMISLKRDAIKIAINAFQTYPYNTGQLKIDYTPAGGLSTLKLAGPLGKRDFEIYLHPWNLSDNATDGDGKGKPPAENAAAEGSKGGG